MSAFIGPEDEAVTMIRDLARLLQQQVPSSSRDGDPFIAGFRDGFKAAASTVEMFADTMRWADDRAKARAAS